MTWAEIASEQQRLVDEAWAAAQRQDGSIDMDLYNAMATAINELVEAWKEMVVVE
jgi:hypothetical protein